MFTSAYTPHLAHHGIKGQRWGVKNGPPYPLKEHKGSERNNTSTHDGKLKEIDSDTFSFLVTAGAMAAASIIAKIRDKQLDQKRIELGRESHERIINLTFNDTNYKENDDVKEYITNRDENTKTDKKTQLPLKKEIGAIEDDLEVVNMEFNSYKNATNNCGLCSATYDMRRRGYDVIVNYSTAEDGGVTIGTLESWYEGGKFKPVTGSEDYYYLSIMKPLRGINRKQATQAIENLAKDKNSRGILAVTWSWTTSGHAMNYEVDNDGQVTLVCPQSNQIWSGKEAIKFLGTMSSVIYMRTDNLEPKIDLMKKEGVFR